MNENGVDPSVEFVVSKLETAIGALSEKMGVAADMLWPALVWKQVAEGVVHYAVTILLFSVSVWAVRSVMKNGIGDDSAEKVIPVVIGLVSLLTLAGTIGHGLTVGFYLQPFAPEWFAFKELLAVVK